MLRAAHAITLMLAAALLPLSCSRQEESPAKHAFRPPGTRLPAPGSSWRPSQAPAAPLQTTGIAHRSLDPAASMPSSGLPPHRTLAAPVELPKVLATQDRWHYLDATQRRAIDATTDAPGWSQLHLVSTGHQHTSIGDLDHYHSSIRQLPDGIAYHFVVENGSGGPDGRITATRRWVAQHHAPPFVAPRAAITIALVGDHSSQPITGAQFVALEELTRYLHARFGPLPVQVASHLPDPLPGRPPIPTPGIPQEIGARLAPR
jgi:hypothetical protein